MPRSYELDSLKSVEQDAFERKQRAWEVYADLRERCSNAHDAMEFAWHDRVAAREEMNSEYEGLQQAKEYSRQVWDEYGRIRDSNNYEIERLRAEADSEHQQMIDCFERASECYEYGDKAEASYWSQQGHEHKERRDELNEEVRRLCEEVKAAKQDAMWRAPKVDASAFHRAKTIFESAKARHETAQSKFKQLKAERDQAKAEFNSALEEYKRAKEAFRKKLEEVKANSQRERDRVLDKAGVRYSERKDAKIVKKSDGTTQVYHGGVGSGDGYGHGHTVLDQFGRKTYDRGAFEEHGEQNFTDDPVLTSYSGRGQWSDIRHGWLGDHKVTWSEGVGMNAGQTLIRDGWVDKEEFDKHHDHYGPDNKYKSGKRIEDITDSLGREKYYSGPSK